MLYATNLDYYEHTFRRGPEAGRDFGAGAV
jgi:hypothetical protein